MNVHTGQTLSFVDLFKNIDMVQIPILQRDYAQGRAEEFGVRNQFLDSIVQILVTDRIQQPLDLDFIYGNLENSGSNIFSVLDGQQRLTTLFLLHWYLAMKDGQGADFRARFLSGQHSRFTYRTRVSATEFFDALAQKEDVKLPEGEESLSGQIRNRQWFFMAWRSDPTVAACLGMLDAIHNVFRDHPAPQLYARLTDEHTPRIVFQFLNLQDFALSDDLYIKMNGRGKILSDFENFKAALCSWLRKKPNGTEIERKIDQEWTDLFCNLSEGDTGKFNALYLRFFLLMAFYRACETIEGRYEQLKQEQQDYIRKLRTADKYIPLHTLNGFDLFDDYNIKRITETLDYCCANLGNDSISLLLKETLENDDYLRQTRFYAQTCFIQGNRKLDDSLEQYRQWKRVTDNLIYNQRIDELPIFISVSRTLNRMSGHREALYEYLVDASPEPGFTQEQWQEEREKAGLILSDKAWDATLRQYECHPYLLGKVGFILNMSRSDADKMLDRAVFEKNSEKVCVLLDDDILASNDFLLQRALFCFGDFTTRQSGTKYNFCRPNRTTYRERDENWLKVVKTKFFADLVGDITIQDKSGTLKQIRAQLEQMEGSKNP